MSSGGTFDQQPHTRARGRWGEDAATRWLRSQGYQILERNFSTRAGEIDLIAREKGVLCFVEVKARASDLYGEAIEAISIRKQRRLAKAATLYLLRYPEDSPCRFDVLGMDRAGQDWRFTLVRDAFQLPG